MTDYHARWYENTEKAIGSYQASLTPKEVKKYKLDLLLRIARRVADFSEECGPCQVFQPDITQLGQELGTLSRRSKDARRAYARKIKLIVRHLKSRHKLVTEGHYRNLGMAIGTGVGAAFGGALSAAGVGTGLGAGAGIGAGLGMTLGAGLDAKAKKDGRVI